MQEVTFAAYFLLLLKIEKKHIQPQHIRQEYELLYTKKK